MNAEFAEKIRFLNVLFFCHCPVFSPQRKSRRYYPTRLAITLAAGITSNSSCSASSNLATAPGSGDAGFIVVETNYRIYAYTSMSEEFVMHISPYTV